VLHAATGVLLKV